MSDQRGRTRSTDETDRCVRYHRWLGRCVRIDEHARADCHYEDACQSCNGTGKRPTGDAS